MNIDMDKIECESCGAHLIFTALTSWSPAEGMLEVNKFFLLFLTFSKLEPSGFPYNARFYTSFKLRKIVNRFVQWVLRN